LKEAKLEQLCSLCLYCSSSTGKIYGFDTSKMHLKVIYIMLN